MLSIGDGIALFSICATIIVALLGLLKYRGNTGTGLCPAHSGIVAEGEARNKRIEIVENDIGNIFKAIDVIKGSIVRIETLLNGKVKT